jgi:hypothetical protein
VRPGDVVLIDAPSIARMFPTWWFPTREVLAGIAPGRAHVKLRALMLDQEGGGNLETAKSIWVAVEEVSGDMIRGTVAYGGIDKDGFRDGDPIEASPDQVFDLARIAEDGRPLLNEERARTLAGKTVLLGVTEKTRLGRSRQFQLFGTVETVRPDFLRLRLRNGAAYDLPPDIRTFENALPGEYRLRSTREVIVNPDFTASWVSESRLRLVQEDR